MNNEMIFGTLMIVLLLGWGFLIWFSLSTNDPRRKAASNEPPKPRIVLPTSGLVYTFSLDTKLKQDEWELLLNSGWELITCNNEQFYDYAHWGPDAPKYLRTKWNYVFKRKGKK